MTGFREGESGRPDAPEPLPRVLGPAARYWLGCTGRPPRGQGRTGGCERRAPRPHWPLPFLDAGDWRRRPPESEPLLHSRLHGRRPWTEVVSPGAGGTGPGFPLWRNRVCPLAAQGRVPAAPWAPGWGDGARAGAPASAPRLRPRVLSSPAAWRCSGCCAGAQRRQTGTVPVVRTGH